MPGKNSNLISGWRYLRKVFDNGPWSAELWCDNGVHAIPRCLPCSVHQHFQVNGQTNKEKSQTCPCHAKPSEPGGNSTRTRSAPNLNLFCPKEEMRNTRDLQQTWSYSLCFISHPHIQGTQSFSAGFHVRKIPFNYPLLHQPQRGVGQRATGWKAMRRCNPLSERIFPCGGRCHSVNWMSHR